MRNLLALVLAVASLAACGDFDPNVGPLNPTATRDGCTVTSDAGPYDAAACAADAGGIPYVGY